MSTALITGGGKGIGLAVTERLVAAGWAVAIADLDVEAGATVAERLEGVRFFEVDVTDAAAMRKVCVEAAGGGGLDGVVTCAGITVVGPSESLDAADWRRVIEIDLTGTFLTCQAAVGQMDAGGSIVTMASIAALRGMPERAAYVAAKSGVVGLTKTLAAEWAPREVRVNSVAPSWVDTPFLRDAAAKGYVDIEELSKRPPLGRLAQSGDVAGVIEFLLGPDAAFVTGQTLYVDGGWSWAA